MSEQDTGPERLDATTLTGVAVVALALAGICALLGSHVLIGALRLTAGVLAGLGAGTAGLVLMGSRGSPRRRRLLAGALAIALAAALTVPAALGSRPDPLQAQATASIAPLTEHDRVTSVPTPAGPDSPVLIRRADGSAQLLRGERVDQLDPGDEIDRADELDPGGELDAGEEDVLALSADGTRLLRTVEEATQVMSLEPGAPPTQETAVPGVPYALAGDVLVVRACEDGVCRHHGHDLSRASAGEEEPDPLWTTSGASETRGADPAGAELPAVPADPDQHPGPLEAVAATGMMPGVALRFDPGQGWVQLDPATGFPVGQVLARPEQTCRIAATNPAPAAPSLHEPEPVVVTLCSEQDGAMTARAHQGGALLWQSQPSPAGQWSVRLEDGRVLATGTEAGADTAGEIVASGEQADWNAPGGPALAEATALTARLGIDGSRMVVTNTAGQLLAYDTADGANTWTQPLREPAGMRGALDDGTVVVAVPAERTEALHPRRAQDLRVIDAATGEVTHHSMVTEEIVSLRGLSGGRALVTTDERTVLLAP